MSTTSLNQDTPTNEQRENNLKKFDDIAGNIVALSTGIGGLNELGIWAGGVKADSVINAIVYSIPALVLATAICLAFMTKFVQWWDTNPQTYATVFARKRSLCRIAIGFSVVGVVLFFVAILVYMARAL